MRSETSSMLKWKNLDGQQKYEIVELARKQGTQVQEVCKTFGISRQTLYRAMDAADTAAIEALKPHPVFTFTTSLLTVLRMLPVWCW